MEVRPGYKLTEAGLVPVAWEVKPVGSVLSIRHGKTQHAVETVDGPYPILATGGQIGTASKPLWDKPSVLIGRKGTINKPQYMDTPFWTVDTLFYSELKGRNSARFFFYLFCTIDWMKFNEASGVPSLNARTIESIKIGVPEPIEQLLIADALNDVDALLDSLDRLIAKKHDLKQAAMQQLLTGQTRLPGFSGEWEVKRLGDLLTYEQPTKYLVTSTEYSDSYEIPVLTAGKTFLLGFTNEEFGVFRNLPAIIFDDFTTASKYVDFEFKAKSSAMKILKAKVPNANLNLIFQFMQALDFEVGEHKRHWISEYQKIEIKFPKESEQSAIVLALADMENEIRALKERRNKTAVFKQGMMQELLSGRTRLA